MSLILSLLESKTLTFTHATLVDFHGPVGEELIRSGIVSASGHERLTTSEDDDDRLVQLSVHEQTGVLGYQSPSRGWVSVETKGTVQYRLDLDSVFDTLLGNNRRRPPSGSFKVDDDGDVWDLGLAFLLGNKPSSVWLARRLGGAVAADRLNKALSRRPWPDLRLILTSSSNASIEHLTFPRTSVVPIADVLSAMDPSSIDFGVLKARFAGKPARAITGPVHLSPDGKVLTINGDVEFVFSGKLQIAVICKLVEAFHKNQRVRAEATIGDCGSSIKTFDRVFGRHWPRLKEFLVSRDRRWMFEI